jgi:hypothetical protein
MARLPLEYLPSAPRRCGRSGSRRLRAGLARRASISPAIATRDGLDADRPRHRRQRVIATALDVLLSLHDIETLHADRPRQGLAMLERTPWTW